MKYLRAIEPEDLDLMYVLENDLRMRDCTATTVPLSRYALQQYIMENSGDLYRDAQVRMAILDPVTSSACGFLDITDFVPRYRRAQVGIALMYDVTGRGLATKALEEASDYARSQGLSQLYAIVAINNASARALFRRAGYAEANVLADWILQDGQYADAVLYRLNL
ncbi:MAG: GNAT family N-acetyltransferase [Paraprevotella sp.]|nr:GNAT family N-acetyltransferase [Paraprevotella sp.]